MLKKDLFDIHEQTIILHVVRSVLTALEVMIDFINLYHVKAKPTKISIIIISVACQGYVFVQRVIIGWFRSRWEDVPASFDADNQAFLGLLGYEFVSLSFDR
jgi:hypothetical protein